MRDGFRDRGASAALRSRPRGRRRPDRRSAVGTANSISDAPLFIAQTSSATSRTRGSPRRSRPSTPPRIWSRRWASGQLDVGAGSPSAGLYNAVARGPRDQNRRRQIRRRPPGYGGDQAHRAQGPRRQRAVQEFGVAERHDGGDERAGRQQHLDPQLRADLGRLEIRRCDDSQPRLSRSSGRARETSRSTRASPRSPPRRRRFRRGWRSRSKATTPSIPATRSPCCFTPQDFAKRTDAATRFMRAYLKGVRFYNGALKRR